LRGSSGVRRAFSNERPSSNEIPIGRTPGRGFVHLKQRLLGMSEGMLGFRWVVPIFAALVSVGVLVWVTGYTARKRLRRSVLLFVPYLLLSLTLATFSAVTLGSFARGLGIAAELLELLLIINLAALLIFDVALPASRLKLPDILHDLSVAGAYTVALVWVMHRADFNIASIVATSAVVTAVIGLSLQSTLGNVIGGLALQIDDSINEGDWIELENKQQGQVKQVRWRHTVIETRDWDTLLVPNSQLLNQTIKLLGKRAHAPLQHRVQVNFNVDFRHPPSAVIHTVDQALATSPIQGVAKEPVPHCICTDLAKENRDSFAYYTVRFWLTDIANEELVSSWVRERIFAALTRANIPLALPASAIFLSQENQARTRRKESRFISEIQRALTSVSVFASLSEAEIEALARHASRARFAPLELIAVQGETADCLYVLAEGEVEVRVASAEGQERVVASMKAPDFFGEFALMTGAPREATVCARGDVMCVRINKSDFQDLLASRPALANEISLALAQRRVELDVVRDDLDAEARKKRLLTERGKILTAIQEFFGIDSRT